jgi:hypothetical protein
MPKLTNRRHEIFATEMAAGAPLLSAYLTAGYKESYSARFNASRLRNTPKVRARIDELLAEFTRTAFVKLEWIQHHLVQIVEGRADSLVRIDDEGNEFTERNRLAALQALLRSLGLGDANVNVVAAAGAQAMVPAEVGQAVRELIGRAQEQLRLSTDEDATPEQRIKAILASGEPMPPGLYASLCGAPAEPVESTDDS